MPARFVALVLSLLAPPPQAPVAPKIASLEPPNGAKDVDAAKTTKLVLNFDRPMDMKSWSLCGSGPKYPRIRGTPDWETSKRLVVRVDLAPGHEYELGVNCPAATNFKSVQGVALEPVVWSFRTGALRNPDGTAGDAEAPKIVSLDPASLAFDLDAKETKRLVVTFDRPMSDKGWSFCGGGPDFPKFKNKPHWDNPKKIVVEIEVAPDQEYHVGLNCPSASNFRSAAGIALEPFAWSFTTAPDKVFDLVRQKAENRKALDALQKVLAESYAYYDLRVRSWDKLFQAHEASILGAKTTRGWAGAVSAMLADTQDVHLHLSLGDKIFPGGKRAVDPLFRADLLPRYAKVQAAGRSGQCGRTEDGIGYVVIGGWTDAKEVDAIEAALPGLRDCKAIVVDVRPNAGGDELLAQRIAAWFVEGERVYGKNRYRTGPGKDGFGPVLERKIAGNAEAEKRLAMPTAVLTSRYVMSSNESFVLMMRQAKDCTVVGQKTYGSSGNPKPHELPNGVTIVLPSWQDMRPDGTCFEGEGLAPDVEVAAEPKDFEDKDPILERALEILRGKSGKAAEKKG